MNCVKSLFLITDQYVEDDRSFLMSCQKNIARSNPARIYLLKVNNRNTRTWCEICSKLTIKIPERRQWTPIVNFEHVTEHMKFVK